MIVYPDNWTQLGQPVTLARLDYTLFNIIRGIDCNNLSFSGGVDSSLLLYYMLKAGRQVRTFTVACGAEHPDIGYTNKTVAEMGKAFHCQIDSDITVYTNGVRDNEAVAMFYKELEVKGVKAIIAGDGIDEYMAGYYAHMKDPTEENYHGLLKRLIPEHLMPLHQNSGAVHVYLPYLSQHLVSLMAHIPLGDKVDTNRRKKITMALAKRKVPDFVLERRKYGFCTSV